MTTATIGVPDVATPDTPTPRTAAPERRHGEEHRYLIAFAVVLAALM